MTKKTFSICRVFIAMILAVLVTLSVSFGNWYLPVIAFVAAWIALYILRSKIKEVIADERDYMINGKASAMAMKIYIFISVIIGLVFYASSKEKDVLFAIGNTLVYSACFLMVLDAFLFKIYEQKDGQN
jgi:uncharacterized membrane protein